MENMVLAYLEKIQKNEFRLQTHSDLLPNRVNNPYIHPRKVNKRYNSYKDFEKEYVKYLEPDKSRNISRYL